MVEASLNNFMVEIPSWADRKSTESIWIGGVNQGEEMVKAPYGFDLGINRIGKRGIDTKN
jgi:hypothetical protein